MKRKVLVLVGTRPEAIKMAPVVKALRDRGDLFDVMLVSTGQHREMLAQTLKDFALEPDINLDLMTLNQSLPQLSSLLLTSIDSVLVRETPDIVLVQGDTTTVMTAALCAFYRGIPCGHVEAGLRSYNVHAPFPEELNRRIAGLVANLHFAPTARAVTALQNEGIPHRTIHLTGNTGIDALLWTVKDIQATPPELPYPIQELIASGRRFVLITGHRRESFGTGFESICHALQNLALVHRDVAFLYPVHMNPNIHRPVFHALSGFPNILLTDPLPYRQFVAVMQAAYCLLTDSGGVQEEAPSLKKPVLVMRDVTERPEGVEAGCSRLVGTDYERIIQSVSAVLWNTDGLYQRMVASENPYGDGCAAERIAATLSDFFQPGTTINAHRYRNNMV